MNRLQSKRARMERQEHYLRWKGLFIDPPEGMLTDSEEDWWMWIDACAYGRAQSLIENWTESQKERTAEERQERADRAYYDLYGERR